MTRLQCGCGKIFNTDDLYHNPLALKEFTCDKQDCTFKDEIKDYLRREIEDYD